MSAFSIFVATPSLRAMVNAPYVKSLIALQARCHRLGIGFAFDMVCGISVIDHARNYLASHFLANSTHSHLLFIDDDMGFNADEIAAMFAWPEVEVIAAMCPKRRIDWERIKQVVLAHPDIEASHLANLTGNYGGMFHLPEAAAQMSVGPKPMPVDAIGTGIMLISRACLLRLIEVAPLHPVNAKSEGFPLYPFFRCEMVDGVLTGEDVAFCNLVRKHGGRILGAPWPVITHSGPYDFIGDLCGIAHYV